jgi:glycosyltransferase involved in cell wall biosynthesis
MEKRLPPEPGAPLPLLAIVVPCYNEGQVLPETIRVLDDLITGLTERGKIASGSFLYFVDDGSRDDSWQILSDAHHGNPRVKGLKLAGNAGHQHALLAGLLAVHDRVDCAISLDADLQDDVRIIEKMIDSYGNGHEIVYGVRRRRSADGFFKRHSALAFYRLMRLSGINLIHNHSDFRLLGKQSLRGLSQFGESSLFLRGIIPQMGYSSESIPYDRLPRMGGESKYPLRKMISLAWNAVCSFSVVPLRLISLAGALIFLFSFTMSLWVLFTKFFGNAVHGWASTLLPIYFLGGIQLLAIGVLGEYLGKIYLEVKRRPRFIKEMDLK